MNSPEDTSEVLAAFKRCASNISLNMWNVITFHIVNYF